MGLKAKLPWWAKIGAKIVLSRLPVPYGLWRRLSLFRHGTMDDPAHAVRVFKSHADRAASVRALPPGFTMLELGPGDSLFSAVVARTLGCARSYLVDAGPFAVRDLDAYRHLAATLREMGYDPPDLGGATSLEDVLSAVGATYLTEGVRSLASIPDGSVDLVWSSVVLEHVPKAEFAELMLELRRVLKPAGVMSHSVDLRDHLANGQNNLRFSESVWEGALFRSAGFYTNRIGFNEMLSHFAEAGFDHRLTMVDRWPGPPLPLGKLHPDFRSRTEEERSVAGFEIVAWPRGVP